MRRCDAGDASVTTLSSLFHLPFPFFLFYIREEMLRRVRRTVASTGTGASNSISSVFLSHLSRVLVVTEPSELRVSKVIGVCQFRKFDLRHKVSRTQTHFFIFSAVRASPHLAFRFKPSEAGGCV